MTLQEMIGERLNRGLSYRDVAEQIGVSHQTLRNVENGQRPSPRVGAAIAGFYGVRYTDLWPLDDEPTAAEAA